MIAFLRNFSSVGPGNLMSQGEKLSLLLFSNFYMIPSFLALVKIKSYFFEKFLFVFWLGFHIKKREPS